MTVVIFGQLSRSGLLTYLLTYFRPFYIMSKPPVLMTVVSVVVFLMTMLATEKGKETASLAPQ